MTDMEQRGKKREKREDCLTRLDLPEKIWSNRPRWGHDELDFYIV
jgi:hypothetical protein